MIRLLGKIGSTVRRVANFDIANHDGSINLSLGTHGYDFEDLNKDGHVNRPLFAGG